MISESRYFQSLSDEEKEIVVRAGEDLLSNVRDLFKEFVDYWEGDCHCVCWDCFVAWLQNKHPTVVASMASDWCWFVNVTGDE